MVGRSKKSLRPGSTTHLYPSLQFLPDFLQGVLRRACLPVAEADIVECRSEDRLQAGWRALVAGIGGENGCLKPRGYGPLHLF